MHFFVTVTITFQGAEGVPLRCFFSPLSLLDGAPHPLLSLLSTEPSHNSFSLKFSASPSPSLRAAAAQSAPSPLLHIALSPEPTQPPLPLPPSLAQSANFRAVARRRRQSQSQFAGCAEGTMFLGKYCRFALGVSTNLLSRFCKK